VKSNEKEIAIPKKVKFNSCGVVRTKGINAYASRIMAAITFKRSGKTRK